MTTQQTDESSPGIFKVIPPRVFALCVLGALLVEITFYDLTLTRVFGLGLAPMLMGIAVSAIGLGFMAWGFFRFADHGTSVNTGKPATMLVTEGAYAFSRNPMYVGFVLILLGPSISLFTPPFLIAALVMFLYLNFYVIQREERYLKQRFGDDYLAYCRRVRRWI